MSELTQAAAPVVADLTQLDDDQLYQQLALRLQHLEKDHESAGDLRLEVAYQPELMGPLDDLALFGRRFFERFNRDAFNLVCSAEDAQERQQVKQAFGLGREAVGGAIVGLLVAHLALAPAVAAVVAALIVRLFLENSYEAMCSVWRDRLPAEPTS
jgi:hypothetical protein